MVRVEFTLRRFPVNGEAQRGGFKDKRRGLPETNCYLRVVGGVTDA